MNSLLSKEDDVIRQLINEPLAISVAGFPGVNQRLRAGDLTNVISDWRSLRYKFDKMSTRLLWLLFLAVLIGCSTRQTAMPHDPTSVYVFASGRFVVGANSKTHEPESIGHDLKREGVTIHQMISLKIEPGTPREKTELIVENLRKAGYDKIEIEN